MSSEREARVGAAAANAAFLASMRQLRSEYFAGWARLLDLQMRSEAFLELMKWQLRCMTPIRKR
jgi:hypothetical protein